MFGILVIAVFVASFFSKSFVKEVYIPEIQPLYLPKVQKLKMFEACNINPYAFEPNECFVKNLTLENEKNNSLRLNLSMIYFINGKGYCKINDKVVSVGQGFDGFRVLRIESNRVLVSIHGKKRWLKLDVYATQKD